MVELLPLVEELPVEIEELEGVPFMTFPPLPGADVLIEVFV